MSTKRKVPAKIVLASAFDSSTDSLSLSALSQVTANGQEDAVVAVVYRGLPTDSYDVRTPIEYNTRVMQILSDVRSWD
jgi:hypothetical protein